MRSSTAVSPADCVRERPRYSSAPECTTIRSRPRRRRILGTTSRRARGGGPSGIGRGSPGGDEHRSGRVHRRYPRTAGEGEVDRRTEVLQGASVRETDPVSVRVRAPSGERDAHPLRGGLSDPHAAGLDHRPAFHAPEVQGPDGHRTARRRGSRRTPPRNAGAPDRGRARRPRRQRAARHPPMASRRFRRQPRRQGEEEEGDAEAGSAVVEEAVPDPSPVPSGPCSASSAGSGCLSPLTSGSPRIPVRGPQR